MDLFSIIVFVVGISSVFAQSLFLRELLVVFYGNEVSVGIILCSWLSWTAMGSFFFSRLYFKVRDTVSALSWAQLVFSAVIILELILIRNLRQILVLEPGEIISPLAIFWVSLLALAPFALVNGFLFSLCVKLFSKKLGLKSIGFVYSLDALGDMVGGLAFSFLFVFFLSPLQNIYNIAVLNLICAACVIFKYRLRLRNKTLLFVLICSFLVLGFNLKPFEKNLLKKEWRGFDLVDTKSTYYGQLYLTKYQDNFSLFENGLLGSTFPLKMPYEEAVHFTFSQAPRVKRVLVVGAAAAGLLYEILKYPVEEIYYLELDPKLIDFIKPYLASKDREALNSPKVKIFNLEARVFLNRYSGKKFDIVMVNTPPPYTAYLNRFYTHEFFNKIKGTLKTGGVFSFALPSKEDYLSKELRDFNSSIYHTLKEVFNHILLIPGDSLRFIASTDGKSFSYDADRLSQRLEKYNIKNEFVNKFYFKARLLPWHIDYVNSVIGQHKNIRLNFDFSPITYYYGVGFFSSYFGSSIGKCFNFLSNIKILFYFLVFFLIWLIIYLKRKSNIFALGTFSLGASGMAAVIITVLGFQIVYGYVYHKIGLINALFMLGVAFGSAYINKKIDRLSFKHLMYVYFIAALYVLVTPFFFRLLSQGEVNLELVIVSIPFFMGILVGLSFPLANKLYLATKPESSQHSLVRGAGILYASDLWGGGFCGLILSLVFIPLYGLILSGAAISFMVLLSMFFSMLYIKRKSY